MIYSENPTLLVCLSGLVAFFQGIFTPLRRKKSFCVFVPKEKIKKANSLSSTTYAALHLICPYVGALIYTRLNDHPHFPRRPSHLRHCLSSYLLE